MINIVSIRKQYKISSALNVPRFTYVIEYQSDEHKKKSRFIEVKESELIILKDLILAILNSPTP